MPRNTYTLSVGQSIGYPHPHPERTAYRNATTSPFSDLEFRIWNARGVMARSIRMQERGAPATSRKWHPLVKLSDGEGY
jgi:hypothetical protein